MMRVLNLFLITFALLFALFVVLVPIFKKHQFLPFQAEAVISPLAEEEGKTTEAARLSGAGIASPAAEVDYYLPYPGILPDHPLYWLKMIRDRILLFFTNEPQARFERLLLYADKRIGAARELVKGNKETLGISTASKAEKYLSQAAEQLEKVATEGKMTAILSDKALRAVEKHEELLEEMLEQVEEEKGVLEETLQLTKEIHKQVLQIVGKD